MSKFMSSRFDNLEAYTPGEQPRDMQYIKLNTNESPYPPSPEVIEAVSSAEVSKLNLYPDPTAKALKQKLADRYGVESKNIFVSNGSDDILNFAFMAFCDDKTGVTYPSISYGFYEVYADLYRIDARVVELKDDFSIDPTDYHNSGRTVVIANPNAPTGILLSLEDIKGILDTNRNNVVLIDEAYIDFGGESCVELVKEYDNLLVVRTFSKSRCLAGARLGFAIANEGLIADLEKIKYSTNPYNINRLSLIAGEKAIDSDDYYFDHCKDIIKAREYTATELKKRGFILTDSYANFVFAKHERVGGEELYLELKKLGIFVRHFSKEIIKDYNRITIGTKEQMAALISAIDSIL